MQYRFFRSELPLLTIVAIIFIVLSRIVRYVSNNVSNKQTWKCMCAGCLIHAGMVMIGSMFSMLHHPCHCRPSSPSSQSLSPRLIFYSIFSFGFLLFVNGSTILFMLAIIACNYGISSLGTRPGYGRSLAPILTWIFNCGILLLNERYHGYYWHQLFGSFGPESLMMSLATWLDHHRGVVPWHGLFNLVVLRMISFNFDRIWSSEQRLIYERDGLTILTLSKHVMKCKECQGMRKNMMAISTSSISTPASPTCTWWREKDHHASSDYNPVTYFVYLFYVPLHFAGPTITFNSFLSHLKLPQHSYDTRGLIRYFLLKTLFIFVLLEFWLHYLYIFSFTNSKTFLSFTSYEMAMVSYYTLVGIWLKFTTIWRFFRCWSLLDGVEPPENMNRCVSNNYSIQSFWRAWHRSFNRWLVRYIYVPLGGGGGGGGISSSTSSSSPAGAPSLPSKLLLILRQSFNIFVTFSFVAFWHDRTLQLLTWGWLVAILFIPELLASSIFNLPSLRHIKQRWYWRHIRGIGAAFSIFMMMVANLIGYSVGIDGTSSIIKTILIDGGVTMAIVVFTAFFSAAMIMFECRDTGITVD